MSDAGSTSDHDSSTGSSTNFQLAQVWLTQCLEHHTQCKAKAIPLSGTPLPSRLINVEQSDRPFLEVVNASTKGPYVALSYAWGSAPQDNRVQTIKSNYTAQQQCLYIRTLPQTIADAIHATRTLKYKYLWVDAICIVQDDKVDLNKELLNMGNIYRYAELTIYAQGGQSSGSGLFVERDPRLYRPCKVSLSTTVDGITTKKNVTLASTCNGPDYLRTRGWVLQERVLSNRCLIFGLQISWACTSHEAQETRPALQLRQPLVVNSFRSTAEQLRCLLYRPTQFPDETDSSTQRSLSFDVWYATVQDYSDKELTHFTDNLKAVSGLAALFHKSQGAIYTAGLWKDDLQRGLGWYVALNDERLVAKERDGPSWSWASVGKVRVRFRSWRGSVGSLSEADAELISISCKLETEVNPYGRVSEGLLILSCQLRKAILQYKPSHADERVEESYRGRNRDPKPGDVREHPRYPALLFDAETKHPVAEAALDRPWNLQSGLKCGGSGFETSADSTLAVWCMLLHIQRFREGFQGTVLILDRIGTDRGVFIRLGLGFLGPNDVGWFGFGDQGGAAAVAAVRQTVRIM
ncbi:Fc.00g058620.m01.CDS01 [Cosmosporella sp. VM-42]